MVVVEICMFGRVSEGFRGLNLSRGYRYGQGVLTWVLIVQSCVVWILYSHIQWAGCFVTEARQTENDGGA